MKDMILKYNPKTSNWAGKLNLKKLRQDAQNDYMQDKWKKKARRTRQGKV